MDLRFVLCTIPQFKHLYEGREKETQELCRWDRFGENVEVYFGLFVVKNSTSAVHVGGDRGCILN